MVLRGTVLALLTGSLAVAAMSSMAGAEEVISSSGWVAATPRDAIRPEFQCEVQDDGDEQLLIRHDERLGLHGYWKRKFEVQGGEFRRFAVKRVTTAVEQPIRSAPVRITWLDATGNSVANDVSQERREELGHVPSAEPEHPVDGVVGEDGWTEVTGTYRVPTGASQAVIELHLQWAPGGSVTWSDVVFEVVPAPAARRVRLATVHHVPKSGTVSGNRQEFVELLERAAESEADLVVLGETLTSVGVKEDVEAIAEAIPGPTTEFYAGQAKRLGLHVVFGLLEREGDRIFNSAVLVDPEGKMVGRYRKVCLPHAEIEQGIEPGEAFPVFETRLGKIGMMICYDGFFPEVARELALGGAEIIAWPVWGCDPLLARARANENRVFIVSSTYIEPEQGWMLSAVYDRNGKPLVQAKNWGTVVVAEVDLSEPAVGPFNLGDLRQMIPRHRPAAGGLGRRP